MATDYATCTNHGPTTVVFPPGMECPFCSGLVVLPALGKADVFVNMTNEAITTCRGGDASADVGWVAGFDCEGARLFGSAFAKATGLVGHSPGTGVALRRAVLDVPGVTACVVAERDTEPGVVQVIVRGGEDQRQTIAESIYRWLPAGIETTGDVEVVVEADGMRRMIRFSYVERDKEARHE